MSLVSQTFSEKSKFTPLDDLGCESDSDEFTSWSMVHMVGVCCSKYETYVKRQLFVHQVARKNVTILTQEHKGW
jgi:hypothetical protein